MKDRTTTTTNTSIDSDNNNNSTTPFNLSDNLPFQLIKSETIPPAPNRSESAIDWLPDFLGYSWIAYGASSLLVISHFPSPLSDQDEKSQKGQTESDPIFRHVLELSSNGSGSVSAVCWSPTTPSVGELAASLDNCIGLFSHNSQGSFCWSQTAILVQSAMVEAIKWTGSGDGLISVGIEVVLWRKKGWSWEIAWKFRPELPQALVSASWSIEGPSATAPLCKSHGEGSTSAINDASRCVLVCHGDGKSKYIIAELRHHVPVSMIQWRPSATKQLKENPRHPLRLVLLTCCADGTVRLWSEIDDGRVRKTGKGYNDQKTTGFSFRVAASIEINQAVNGILGSDIFVRWATELDGIFNIGKKASQYFSSEEYQHDKAGSCDWLIGVGPQKLVTFWAVHCLDDVSPLRFPRVTLWKRRELLGSEMGTNSLLLHKVVVSRNQIFGPPNFCSVVRLFPCNYLACLQLYSRTLFDIDDGSLNNSETENLLSCCASGILNIDGHTGKILQVAVHSHGCEIELAASLDTDGLILFWSLSNCTMGLPTLSPAFKLSGKIAIQDSHPKYTSLRWAPAVIDQYRVLLMGHVGGIDCFIVKICENEENNILCNKLCTIPFTSDGDGEGPTSVWSIPLTSTCSKTFVYNNFMLLAIWKDGFQALSWKITIHPHDLPGGCCECSFDFKNIVENSTCAFESVFSGKRYCVSIDPCSSTFPDPYNHDNVTSVALVGPSNFVLAEEQKQFFVNGLCSNYFAYHMITGCFDGSLKLWRSEAAQLLNSNPHWELVGMLAAHGGPITRISPTDCGRKIATIAQADQSNNANTLHIWEAVNLAGVGSFILEETISFDKEIVALNWLTVGNGQLLLGVCLQNELQVYATRRCGGQNYVESEKSLDRNIWFCVALTHTDPAIRNFFWGPKATVIIVHDDYFCLFSQWLLPIDKKRLSNCHQKICNNNSLNYDGASDKDMLTAIFTDSDICALEKLTVKDNAGHCLSRHPIMMNVKNCILSSMSETFRQKYNTCTEIGFWSILEIAEKLGGSLPVYHPEVLLMNMCSGNWKRAQIALRHLVEHLTSNNASLRRYSSGKFSHVIPPINLSTYLEGFHSSSSSYKAFDWSGNGTLVTSSSHFQKDLSSYSSSLDSNASSNSFTSSFTRSEMTGFVESLEKLHDLADITNDEKMQILAIIDLLDEVTNSHAASAYGGLDEPGRRFWVAVRFQQLCFVRRVGRLPSMAELVVNSRLTGWAFHSDCQENLFNSLLANEPSWQEMRTIGVGFWYTNVAQLRLKMERLAKQQYLKSKDPKACALLYIALNRLQVLAGLFKISKDEKDKPLVGFLSRNFQEEKNKGAALKNAYVLMGRHQLELAVAFFLLGGDIASAINVCAKNLGDEQLALVICRLVEGYGGSSERSLISKLLLPSAIEKGDYWQASFLEWVLENYLNAFLQMFGGQADSLSNTAALLSNQAPFLDPSIGHYCLMLATKNSMKNAIGEQNAAILGRWAILMSSTALSRCGLPLEALECLSSSLSIFGGNQGNASDNTNPEILNERLKPSPNNSSLNWVTGDVALHMDSHAKFNFAMQYITKLLREHPSWSETVMAWSGACGSSQSEFQQYNMLLSNFQHKLISGLAYFELKFSLTPLRLINMIIISLCNYGLMFIGCHILQCTSEDLSQGENIAFDVFPLYPSLPKLLLKATEEFSYLFLRYTVICSMTCLNVESCSGESSSGWMACWRPYMQGLLWSVWNIRAGLKLFSNSCAESSIIIPLIILDLYEYYVYFASAWFQRNSQGLILVLQALSVTYNNDGASCETIIENLNKSLPHIAELLAHNRSTVYVVAAVQTTKVTVHEQGVAVLPVDDRWQIIRASLWGLVSGFLKYQIDSLPEKLEDGSFHPQCKLSSLMSSFTLSECNINNTKTQIHLVSVILATLLKMESEDISSYCANQLASLLLQKVGDRSSAPTLLWLEALCQSRPRAHYNHLHQNIDCLSTMNNEKELSAFEILWNMFADPKMSYGGLALEYSKWSQHIKQKHSKGWRDVCTSITGEYETADTGSEDERLNKSSPRNAVASPVDIRSPDNNSFVNFGSKDSAIKKKSIPFQNPKEIHKRNGELIEALCINSINQQQAAVASNKKGIIFFNWEDGRPPIDKSNYIWTEADWPNKGWAGSESTPVPTCVSPGIGLGSKKGTHLGLGGATIGGGSMARPGREFTGGGAFGIPGYAGVGASGLGWEIQEDFEEFIDPPATVENIRTRAFSSHPYRPFFLVGSSNTHVYLWEFSKDMATATYGVLPAANVPPPYALASISAVQFDHSGQRFATAALDGTVCTWQLEVGGRNNIHPTESSLCFNNYTSDVTYVSASGSIVAAAGYSSDNVNVVIWDTLAPPATSRASILCHEGGARSLSVFANDIGSGSISPLIVTGGKGGDVGVHDFRYIATGKAKRHRNSDSGEHNINTSTTAGMQTKRGDQNRNGMLWYIPKAHSGSVTRISAIPNTSFFLTGSKDGDVKLWDAKRSKLVFHWPKLHDRHTFLQPSSRGFGGVVRAAVTDIQVVSNGFLTCGGDGSVKLVQFRDFL